LQNNGVGCIANYALREGKKGRPHFREKGEELEKREWQQAG